MDFENIGPIALFIAYMAISAWAKQRKARQRMVPQTSEQPALAGSKPRPVGKWSGILDQLKQELFEEPEPFTLFQGPAEPKVKMKAKEIVPEPVAVSEEGSDNELQEKLLSKPTVFIKTVDTGRTLDEILLPFSKLEQGIILHELLGKPRAYQDQDEWFHKS